MEENQATQVSLPRLGDKAPDFDAVTTPRQSQT